MCLYPRQQFNKKYTNTIKNGGNIPPINDMRTLYVPVNCGNCIECRKQKTRDWQVRLLEDIKDHRNGKFVTLTFSNESILELCKKLPNIKGYTLDNAIAKLAVKLFRERHRKKYGKSIRHWLVTELGHKGTENIHLHGILWTNEKLKDIEDIWQYGYTWKGDIIKGRLVNYVNEKTVGYCTKYVSKQDLKHPNYKPIILTSPGIGGTYTKRIIGDWQKNKYNGDDTNITYRTNTGHKVRLPNYWKNKIYNDDEKEKLWINTLDKNERWIRGEKYDISNGMDGYFKAQRWHRLINIELGYGSDEIDYEKKEAEEILRVQKQNERLHKAYKKNKK